LVWHHGFEELIFAPVYQGLTAEDTISMIRTLCDALAPSPDR